MRRYDDPDEPRIYFLPNLMTAGNLACGFFAVLMIFKGLMEVQRVSIELGHVVEGKLYYDISHTYYEYAILLIFGSCLFDLLDGRLARMGGQDSPFGREFDSLADIISFGMAPAMLLSRAILPTLEYDKIAWAIALIYLVCGAMRLARFNCLALAPRRAGASSDFRGLPIPMAAGFIASLTFLLIDYYKNDRDLGNWKWVLAGAMLGLSLLMISNVRYPSFKKVGLRTRGTFGALIIAILLILATVHFRYTMPVILFSVYLAYGLVRPWIARLTKKDLDVEKLAEDIATTEPEDPENTPKL